MGNGISGAELVGSNRPSVIESYSALPGQRFLADRDTSFQQKNSVTSSIPRSLLNVEFSGKWSMLYPDSICPEARFGQCSQYSAERDSLIICYGENHKGQYFNDCWILEFSQSLKWSRIETTLLSPRAGSSCVLVPGSESGINANGDVLFIFGGECNGTYYTDLHAIDLSTGEVKVLSTTGFAPEARKNAVMGYLNGKITIWGGFNGKCPSNIHVLDLSTMKWSKVDCEFQGRAAPAFTVCGSDIWIYGSTRNQGLIKLDMLTETIIPIETTGAAPPMSIQSAFMIRFDRFLMIFGGKGEEKMTHVYAFDIERQWWFLFHVRPDGDTLTVADGSVIEGGLFMLPREYGYSACYRECERTIIGVLGSSIKEPPPIYEIYVGDALSFLNHRTDMLEMFHLQ